MPKSSVEKALDSVGTHRPGQRALAWMVAGVLAAAFGTFGWLLSVALALLGFGANAALGLGLPAWTMWMALAIGMPLGAWLEIRMAD